MPDSANVNAAIDAWTAALGAEYVITDEQTLAGAETATFATSQRIKAILCPADRDQVQACVLIANNRRVPLYPVSAGKNWGYGSRVPPSDDCVILALGRLDRIVDFDEKLAYITVEPGVTFEQVNRFLKENNSRLMINVPGSTHQASLIGNALERGTAHGLNGDRWTRVCGLEVVMPTGKCIHTGLERFSGARASKVFAWGIGPSLDGLFSQSNLGIVTRMTLWLDPIPDFFQYFSFSIDQEDSLGGLIDNLQSLRRDGLLETTCGLYNHYRVLTYLGQYPWDESEGKTPLSSELLNRISGPLGGGVWFGEGAIIAPNREIGEIKQKHLRARLRGSVDDLSFKAPNEENPLIGHCMNTGLSSVYWRKRSAPPEQMDPDVDRCGVIWCCPVSPFSGKAVSRCLEILERTMVAFGFEPIIGIQCLSIRAVYVLASIVYDRNQEGHDETAMQCHDAALRALADQGFFPYRLGIQAMTGVSPSTDDYGWLLRTLKDSLDPFDILAPGRYDFRQEWPD
jgi:4-cresol dehydrogenase (hydroxylating)